MADQRHSSTIPCPLPALSVAPQARSTSYPAPFASVVAGRVKRKLGDHFGLSNFGVNLTELRPGAASALPHHHSKQDEFIYVLQGTPTLVLGDKEHILQPGDCFGQMAGSGLASQLINRSEELVLYLEIGDRSAGDDVVYPAHDLKAVQCEDGSWVFTHKDGQPY